MPLAPLGHDAAEARCRELATRHRCRLALVERCSMLPAHKYSRLRHALEQGHAYAATPQMKAPAEVPINLPGLRVVRLLASHGVLARHALAADGLPVSLHSVYLGGWFAAECELVTGALQLPDVVSGLRELALLQGAQASVLQSDIARRAAELQGPERS